MPRPPAENRIKLYGLYKQATEGDVDAVMPRPVGFTAEDEGAKKKWDAWKREQGLLKTEAKRRYIAFLIETMKVYALGTLEARELLSELEYLWDQIKDLPDEEPAPKTYYDRPSSYQVPQAPNSPSLSQYSATPGAPGLLYRNNLQRIYSHSRRSITSLDHEYPGSVGRGPGSVGGGSVGGSVGTSGFPQSSSNYPYPIRGGPGSVTSRGGGQLLYSLPDTITGGGVGALSPNAATLEEFKNWRAEMNMVVNKLRNDYTTRRPLHESDEEEDELDPQVILRRRLRRLVRTVGWQAWRLLKAFSLLVVAILFVIWCLKRNVSVKLAVLAQPMANGRQRKEMVVNMVISDENKWFIRLLKFVNTFVGFV